MNSMIKLTKTWAVSLLCLLSFQLHGQAPAVHNFNVANGLVTLDATFPPSPGDSTAKIPTESFFLATHMDRPIPMDSRPNATGDTIKASLPVPPGIFPGKRMFTVLYQFDTIFTDVFPVANPLTGPGQQPTIQSMAPTGTLPGRVVTVTGRGFGNNLDDIYIWFTTSEDTLLPPSLGQVINPTQPTYLTSPDANGLQQLKFMLPGENGEGDIVTLDKQPWLEYELRMRVVVKGQPSANSEILSIVASFYRTKLLIIILGIFGILTLAFWLLAMWMKRRGLVSTMSMRVLIIDQTTNRLSLAKCQALAWTIVLTISYSYYVLMTFEILDKSNIPDFDPSLLILMGISTTGLMIARTQDKNAQQKAKEAGNLNVAKNPSLWDLISENGTVNLASLQLLVFTLIGIGIYIVYMTSPTLVETGLPTLPDTLLALMGISQGGYVTGKAVEGSGSGAQGNTDAAPAQPEALTQPETPVQPVAPTQPVEVAQPVAPAQPVTPAQPVQPVTQSPPETVTPADPPAAQTPEAPKENTSDPAKPETEGDGKDPS